MKKNFIVLCTVAGLLASTASADGLKNSLTNMMNKKETTPAMVDLSNLSVNGKPRRAPQAPVKTRSSKAVVATVNGHKIIKKDADAYLAKRTNGQVKNFDLLPKKQRTRLVQEMSVADIAYDMAEKELTTQEKTAVLTRVWMQKEAKKINVTDAQVQEMYDTMKKRAAENNSTKPVPEFSAIKNNMKMQMTEKAIIGKLMSDVKITVINANMIAGSINDTYISIEDANNALNSVSKGKATWKTVSDRDRTQLLKMIAPSKLIEASLKTDLSETEKISSLSNFWMQNKVMKTEVSDKALKNAYAKIEKASKKAKSKKKLPPFEQLKQTLQMQIAKEKVVADLMKSAKIKLK
jgi:hypothetical protein